MGATLQQDRADACGAELVERRSDAGRLVLSGGHDHIRAVGLERIGGGTRSGSGHDHRQRDLASSLDQL